MAYIGGLGKKRFKFYLVQYSIFGVNIQIPTKGEESFPYICLSFNKNCFILFRNEYIML